VYGGSLDTLLEAQNPTKGTFYMGLDAYDGKKEFVKPGFPTPLCFQTTMTQERRPSPKTTTPAAFFSPMSPSPGGRFRDTRGACEENGCPNRKGMVGGRIQISYSPLSFIAIWSPLVPQWVTSPNTIEVCERGHPTGPGMNISPNPSVLPCLHLFLRPNLIFECPPSF